MKTKVIPNSILKTHVVGIKGGDLLDLSLKDGLASYQLVGEVMAHQGV